MRFATLPHARFAPLLALLALALAPAGARAQGAWTDELDRPGLFGRVFALGEWQGQLVAGGLELSGDGLYPGNLALFDGARWRQLGGGIHGAQIRDFALFQGELVTCGEFVQTVGGGAIAWNVARYDGTEWHPLGGNEMGPVFALAVFHDELYAGGESGLRRWNGAQWVQVAGGLDGPCYALFVAPDDRLYVGGPFSTAGGVSSPRVAAWNGASWSAVGGGLAGAPNATVWDFAWYGGELWAGGSFDVAGGQPHEKVAIFDGSSWRPAGVFPDSSIATFVYAVEVLGDDLYVAGTIPGTDTVFSPGVVRWDGSSWSGIGGVYNGNPTTGAFALQAIGGTLYVGGEFSRLQTYLPGQGIVSNSVGAFDGTSWSNVGQGFGLDSDPEAAVLWRGELVVAGGFAEAGVEVANGPMAFDGTSWRNLGPTSGGSVDALLEVGGDLYATGGFTSIGGQPAAHVARYDGTTWHPVGSNAPGGSALALYRGELYVGGFGVHRFDGTSWTQLQPQIFGFVTVLHVHDDVLYIGGSLSGSSNIVSWDGTQLATVGGGTNASVWALESFEGDLLAGGDFTQAGGVSANRLARWNGSSWSAFGGLTGTVVYDLTHFQGQLVASGNLFVPGLPPEKYLARWDGAAWQPFGGGFANGAAFTRLVPDDLRGSLWGAGIVTQADGVPSWYLARWDEAPAPIGTAFCAGDGSAGACPCGNTGASGTGCDNSAATGGVALAASAFAPDGGGGGSLELVATGFPPSGAPTVVAIRSTARSAEGAAAPFGDGLLCLVPPVARVGSTTASAGQAGVVLSHGAGPGAFHYQLWYRNAASFCTPAAFNLSNGLTVVWP